MKRFLQILLMLSGLVVPAAAQTKISAEPRTSTTQANDDLLLNSTNTGSGNFTTKIMSAGQFVASPLNSSNRTIYSSTLNSNTYTGSIFYPSNIFASAATITSTNGSNIWIGSAGAFTGRHIGDDFVIGASQFTVVDIDSATQIVTIPAANSNYNNANFTWYPANLYFEDINGNPAGALGNGCTIALVGTLGNNFNVSRLLFANRLKSAWIDVGAQVDGTRIQFSSVTNGPIFNINTAAGFDSLRVLADGTVSTKFGLTNATGTLSLLGTVSVPGNVTFGSSDTFTGGTDSFQNNVNFTSNIFSGGLIGITATNVVVNAATISGTNGSFTFTNSTTTAFAGLAPGWVIKITNAQYTIDAVTSPSTVQVMEKIIGIGNGGYSNAPFSLVPPAMLYSNATPTPAGFVAADGSVGVVGANNQSNGRYIFANNGHGFEMSMISQAEGWRLEIGGQAASLAAYAGAIAINEAAPFDSWHIYADGQACPRIGITGTHPINTSNTAGSDIVITGGASTGNGAEGQIVFKTSGSAGASTSLVTNNMTERFRVNTNGVQVSGGGKWNSGTGTPLGNVVGSVGDLWTRTDGGASTTLYVKESGTATTAGWVAK